MRGHQTSDWHSQTSDILGPDMLLPFRQLCPSVILLIADQTSKAFDAELQASSGS